MILFFYAEIRLSLFPALSRTYPQAVEMEKKKTDGLLFEMLPRDVAQSLKEGRAVEPIAYESSTILFAG